MKKLFTLFMAVGALGARAQMDSCNVFMQANHVEMGISPVGSYGSSVGAPSGYHGNVTDGSNYNSTCGPYSYGTNHVGFVADIDMDGWSTGTPPYFGDYFLPGSPFEGWELEIAGSRLEAINDDSTYTGTLTCTGGANISYSATGGTITSTWQGMIDSVVLTQVTTIDTGSLFFTTNITLTNLSTSPKNDIYYMRSLDPDNEEPETGIFTTINTILHQSTDTTVVTATGTTYATDVLGLGTTDTNATCLVYADWPLSSTVSLGAMYNQTYTDGGTLYTQGTSNTNDFAIGLVFSIPHLATVDSAADSVARVTSGTTLHPANSASFTFFYSFGHAGLDSALSALGSHIPTAVSYVNQQTNVKVYPNPAHSMINVSGLNAGDQVSLVDMMGQTLYVPVTTGIGTAQLSSAALNPGSYLLIVTDKNGQVVSRSKVQKQ